jgi:hypothetical protein
LREGGIRRAFAVVQPALECLGRAEEVALGGGIGAQFVAIQGDDIGEREVLEVLNEARHGELELAQEAGLDEAGIGEIAQQVLRVFEEFPGRVLDAREFEFAGVRESIDDVRVVATVGCEPEGAQGRRTNGIAEERE